MKNFANVIENINSYTVIACPPRPHDVGHADVITGYGAFSLRSLIGSWGCYFYNHWRSKVNLWQAYHNDQEDVLKVANISNSKVVAVHLEAVNHCSLKKIELNNFLSEKGLYQQVIVPNDGEIMCFT
ncbi:MAG TPA: hypothetical protein VNU45_15370 [Rummeliibacillus sp.]|nr:hypothetical protein [Rummeliibacillus sp.]